MGVTRFSPLRLQIWAPKTLISPYRPQFSPLRSKISCLAWILIGRKSAPSLKPQIGLLQGCIKFPPGGEGGIKPEGLEIGNKIKGWKRRSKLNFRRFLTFCSSNTYREYRANRNKRKQ